MTMGFLGEWEFTSPTSQRHLRKTEGQIAPVISGSAYTSPARQILSCSQPGVPRIFKPDHLIDLPTGSVEQCVRSEQNYTKLGG